MRGLGRIVTGGGGWTLSSSFTPSLARFSHRTAENSKKNQKKNIKKKDGKEGNSGAGKGLSSHTLIPQAGLFSLPSTVPRALHQIIVYQAEVRGNVTLPQECPEFEVQGRLRVRFFEQPHGGLAHVQQGIHGSPGSSVGLRFQNIEANGAGLKIDVDVR